MKYLFVLVVVIIGSCKPHVGSVNGNIFWKYNDYVGNKPDAGSSIDIYKIGDTISTGSAICDVKGDFIMENIPIGKYMLIAKSENTNASALDHVISLSPYFFSESATPNLAKQYVVIRNDIDTIRRLEIELFDKYDYNHRIIRQREEDVLTDHLDSISRAFLAELKNKEIFPYPLSKKQFYKVIEVKPEQTTNVVVDFGVTYTK